LGEDQRLKISTPDWYINGEQINVGLECKKENCEISFVRDRKSCLKPDNVGFFSEIQRLLISLLENI